MAGPERDVVQSAGNVTPIRSTSGCSASSATVGSGSRPANQFGLLASLQRTVGNGAVAAMLARPSRAARFLPAVQRTPATWAASPAVAQVAGYTGSATYWQPIQTLVAQYGTLLPTDLAGRSRVLRELGERIAAWRANQARGLWTSTLDAQKEAALVTIDALITTEQDAVPGARTTADLGRRLTSLFLTSTRAEQGLEVAALVPQERVRAALQSPANLAAINSVLTRNPVAGLAPGLTAIRAFLATLAQEIAAPTTAGVTASDAARETRVEQILTPAATRAARAAAAASGGPAPAFQPAHYYEDIAAALHTQMLRHWAWAGPMDARPGLDTAAGGHVEGMAAEAKRRVDALYGMFGSAAAPRMTFASGTLSDRGTEVGDPYDMARWMVREGADQVGAVKTAHNAFEDSAASQAIENRVIDHYSGRSTPAAANEVAAMAATGLTATQRAQRLRTIDRMWPGVQTMGRVSMAMREAASPAATRAQYWGMFKTMIHEYLHTTAHPTYTAWYGDLLDSHHRTTYQEGFTDLFTLRTWESVFPQEIEASRALRTQVQGAADPALDLAAVGGAPSHYPELAEAQVIETEFGAANMKAAYFRGNTAVLGGGRLPTR